MTLLMAAPRAAGSSADAASSDDSGWLDEYGANHLVVAGADEPDWSSPPTWLLGPRETPRFEYLAYYPTELQIHRGDVVFFRVDRFHNVTFSPEGAPREGALRRDEVEPLVAMQQDFPSDPTCGTSAEAPPRVLDSTDEFLHSGVNDLKLQVDLPEGAYSNYCMVHPGMEGTVEVVPDEEPIATPAEVEADRRAEIEADTATAVALLENPPAVRAPEPVGDRRRWFVHAGEITPDQRVAVLLNFPSSLTIAPGDEVQIGVPAVGEPLPGRIEPVAEYHTATFEPRPVNDSGILVPPDSPCRFGCDPWTGERLPSTFTSSFPNEGRFVFRCQLHGHMRGAINVSG